MYGDNPVLTRLWPVPEGQMFRRESLETGQPDGKVLLYGT